MSTTGAIERALSTLPRPLDPLRSIKLKLGVLVVASGAAGLLYFGLKIGWLPPGTSAVAIGLALLTTQILANGMTRPLREMTAAARAMARGDYTQRVRTSSRDEVGELAQAFNLMAADLAAADQHRRELIANVSHELRTPISALRAVLENLVDGVSVADPPTLQAALAQTDRLGRLVTELLDLSRIDAGAHPLERETFELAPFLADAVAQARVNAAGAGREVRLAWSAEPPEATAIGDPERLKQVVLNLVDNAVRHGPPGGAVGLVARRSGDVILIEVSDEGPGIAAEERERVFERFTRGEPATGGGTGLGLAIARWVVQLHGGRIEVVPAPGCLIRVSLPVPPQPESESAPLVPTEST